ncbi:hypothetical protein FQR65_LT12466 [Abscondita terminalis]|nr:hypothetical protein FQR65_LT12466 [Abscondita terminalis]
MGLLFTKLFPPSVPYTNKVDEETSKTHDPVVFFDLETSGFSRNSDILQIAAQCDKSTFSVYINPIQKISPYASEVTGLTNINGELWLKDVRLPTIPLKSALKEFLNFLIKLNRPVILLAHNCKFDAPILINAIKKSSMIDDFESIVVGFADSLPLIKAKTGRKGKGECTLSGLASWLNISSDDAHNAVYDVAMLAKIIKSLEITTDQIIHSTTTWNDSMSSFERKENENITLRTLLPLSDCVSDAIKKKLARANISHNDLINTYYRDGEAGINRLLGKDENGKVRVTTSQRIIHNLIRICDNKVTSFSFKMAEQFSLRWNNFHSNLSSGFHELMEANDMVDVTLAVDGQFLQAHKLVLSICSPLFKQLFKINPCKHPVIILRDVTYGNLKDILAFMYLGEVNVLRDNLSSFLRTAELLQVKGLTGDDSSDTSSKKDKTDSICDNEIEQDMQQFGQLINSSSETQSPSPQTANSNKRSKMYNSQSKRSKVDAQMNIVNTKSVRSLTPPQDDEGDYLRTPSIKQENSSYASENEDTSCNQEQIIDCQGLNKATLQDSSSQDHGIIEIINEKRPYKCPKCKKRFSRRDHLRTHEKNIHGEKAGPFACIICSQLYKNSESLRKHIAKYHYH